MKVESIFETIKKNFNTQHYSTFIKLLEVFFNCLNVN